MEENISMVKKHFMFSVSCNLEMYYRLVSDLYLEYIKAMLCTTEVLVISVAFFFFLLFRCLQDKVLGQYFSDAITNRKEKVRLQISEDCLYLNVYTPVSTEEQEKLPVSKIIVKPLANFIASVT